MTSYNDPWNHPASRSVDEIRNRALTKPTTAGRIFTTAIAVLRRKGWTREEWHDMTGQVCLMGAVEDAMIKILGLTNEIEKPEELRNATNTVAQYLEHTYPEIFNDRRPENWNDEEANNIDDVIDALEHIATKEASTPFDHLLAART